MKAIESKKNIFRLCICFSVCLYVCTFVHTNLRIGLTDLNAVFTKALPFAPLNI